MRFLLVAIFLLVWNAVCSAGGLRLVSKTGKIKRVTSGRLEVHMNGEWGTVCFRNFEKNDAIFACKEMGFKEESPHYSQISSAEFPATPSSTPVWLVDIDCNSNSTGRLSSCLQGQTGPTSEFCTHSEDVVLSCSNRKGLGFKKKLILAISLGALLIVFIIALFILCACTLPTALHRRTMEKKRESEGADKESSAPLLANMDDMTDVSELISSRPPPTNPAMMSSLGQTMMPPLEGGVVSEPLRSSAAMPTAPPMMMPNAPYLNPLPPQMEIFPPLPVSYYAPQESSMYHAPDAPPGALPSVSPADTGSVYPLLPTVATTLDVAAPDGAAESEMGDDAKKRVLLTDPRLHYDLKASATSISAIASAVAGVEDLDTGASNDPLPVSSTKREVLYPSTYQPVERNTRDVMPAISPPSTASGGHFKKPTSTMYPSLEMTGSEDASKQDEGEFDDYDEEDD